MQLSPLRSRAAGEAWTFLWRSPRILWQGNRGAELCSKLYSCEATTPVQRIQDPLVEESGCSTPLGIKRFGVRLGEQQCLCCGRIFTRNGNRFDWPGGSQ